MHITCIVGMYYYWDPKWLLVSVFGVLCISNYGLGVYCHRYLSHCSFKVPRKIEIILNVFAVMSLQGSPLTWAANHVKHHKHADNEGDPHPAANWFKTWFWLNNKTQQIDRSVVRRLCKDKMHKLTEKYYFQIFWSLIILSFFIDPRITVYFFSFAIVLSFHVSSFTNVILHKFGYRNFDTNDTSTNLPLPLLVESPYHNNHHNDPSNYNTSVKWHEFDIYKYLIDLIKI
jgi:fatty-acid desaturase